MQLVFLVLLITPTLQWPIINPTDFQREPIGSLRGVPPYQQQATQLEEPPMYMMNPFVSPLARKWRKLRSRRDQDNRLA